MFEKVVTKRVERNLCEILETDKVTNTNEKGVFKLIRGEDAVKFTANKKPAVGDFVIEDPNGNYKIDPEYAKDFFCLGDEEPAEIECEKCAELEEDKQLLLEENTKLQEENEALKEGTYTEPFEYNPEKLEDMNFKEAQAACEDGQAVTRDCWKGVYMTYDEKKGLMSHVRGTNPKPLAIDKASLEAKDFYVMENI